MDKAEIINDIKNNKGAEIPALQKKYGVSYREAKALIEELLADGTLVYECGLKYGYVPKAENPVESFISELQRRRSEESKMRSSDNVSDEDDDVDLDFDIDDFLGDDDEDGGSVVRKFMERKTSLLAQGKPVRLAWCNEEAFEEAVRDRLVRLVKSDKKMGRQGAIRKAENYLEAVRDTHDGKMVQVYERLLYEVRHLSDYAYAQLKKQYCED